MKTSYLAALCCGALTLLLSLQAEATPAFARSQGLPCGACHSAFPALNAFGRMYKSRGYRLTDASQNAKKTDFTTDVSKFPAAAAIVSRPYTKLGNGNGEIRAIHELELFAGGILYRNLSGFIEVESESEDGFGNVLGLSALNYDFNNAFHVQLAYAPTFFADPYDTLSSSRRLTAAHYNILNDLYGGADNGDKLRHSRQQVSLFGRVLDDRLFYDVGVGGLTGDLVANKSKVGFGRLAFDVTPNAMIGVFGLKGSCEKGTAGIGGGGAAVTCPTKRDFSRYGLDTQIDVGPVRVTGVFLRAKDDRPAGTVSDTLDDAYIQAAYFGHMGGDQVVPLLRYQTSEGLTGTFAKTKTKRYTAGVTYYFQENFKGSIEYSNDLSTPTGVKKNSDLTIQLMAAF
jgi:hypothetical protein